MLRLGVVMKSYRYIEAKAQSEGRAAAAKAGLEEDRAKSALIEQQLSACDAANVATTQKTVAIATEAN
jgi:hypothetical protein